MARHNRTYAGERYTAFLGIHLTPSQESELAGLAATQGAPPSTYARELLFQRAAAVVAATRRHPEAHELKGELRAIGNNLNQLTRRAHTTGELDPFDDLHAMLKAALARVIAL